MWIVVFGRCTGADMSLVNDMLRDLDERKRGGAVNHQPVAKPQRTMGRWVWIAVMVSASARGSSVRTVLSIMVKRDFCIGHALGPSWGGAVCVSV